MYIDWQSNKIQRLCTSAVIVACLAVAILIRQIPVIGLWVFDVLVLVLAMVAVWEVMKVKKIEDKGVSIYFVLAYAVSAYGIFVLGFYSFTTSALMLHIIFQIIVICVFAIYTFFMNYMDKEFLKECKLKNKTLGKSAWATAWEFVKIVIYPLALLLVLIPINHLGTFAQTAPIAVEGEPVITDLTVAVPMFATLAMIMVFAISCFTDTFAYCVGLTLKGPKLCPKISPKKTISGAVGGLFGGVIAALLCLLCFVRNNSLLQKYLTEHIGGTVAVQCLFIVVGLAGAIITQCGDLYASWIKRRAGVKDYGSFLPGHGGAMDRLDGICFNSVFIFITFMLIIL